MCTINAISVSTSSIGMGGFPDSVFKAPYIPPIDPSNASDTQNFDDTFLDMEPVLDEFNEAEQSETDQEPQTDADRTDDESNTTPSQSRSSSLHPQPQKTPEIDDNSVDVFDGYSFKGRHSVLLDDEEHESSESEESEEMSHEDDGILDGLVTAAEPTDLQVDGEEVPEPKTPEARPHALPEIEQPPKTPEPPAAELQEEKPRPDVTEPEAKPRPSAEHARPQTPESPVAPAPVEKDAKPKVVHAGKPATRPVPARQHRQRREKSGVPALDRYLSDAIDEDEEATERDDDEDDDWDFIEAVDGEDRNGTKGTSLFARGVVDRYRLAVFRKASIPSQRASQRSVSGTSQASETTVGEGSSPSPSQRRGRAPLTFRKHPRQFLRAKSPGPPPSSFSSKSSLTAKSLARSGSATLSAASTQSSNGLLTPSTSMAGSLASPSLKSKESAASVGNHSLSSSQSGGENGQSDAPHPQGTVKGTPPTPDEPEKQKNRKLKKYKENAEKVFSIFSSPR
ncbi:hypothetical protein HGRIS_008602 [Hohenbuehelia grisea]|uniref:Uncharacterized protein n=1 Tax=Hohenbuehelia grisea TaxID=104357 RepID=A0ABR3J8S2_9AGAR